MNTSPWLNQCREMPNESSASRSSVRMVKGRRQSTSPPRNRAQSGRNTHQRLARRPYDDGSPRASCQSTCGPVRTFVSVIAVSLTRAAATCAPSRSSNAIVHTRSSPSVAVASTPGYWAIQLRNAPERRASVIASADVSRGGPSFGVTVVLRMALVESSILNEASTLCLPFGSRTAVHVRLGASYTASQCAPLLAANSGPTAGSLAAMAITRAAVSCGLASACATPGARSSASTTAIAPLHGRFHKLRGEAPELVAEEADGRCDHDRDRRGDRLVQTHHLDQERQRRQVDGEREQAHRQESGVLHVRFSVLDLERPHPVPDEVAGRRHHEGEHERDRVGQAAVEQREQPHVDDVAGSAHDAETRQLQPVVMASHPDVEPLGMALEADSGHVGTSVLHPTQPR